MTPSELLESVRNYLDITWADTETDTKLTGIIGRGIARLQDIAGVPLDFIAEDSPRALLFDYCFYARANALDEFETNYLSMLVSLEQREAVRAYVALTSLSALTIGSLSLTPAFDPATTFYAASTSDAGDIITAVPTNPAATIIITNGIATVVNGSAATWVTGENLATITITNGSAITIYTLKISKVA